MLRPTALIPVIFGLAAFVLTMLCIFAGSKPNFMQNYSIITLNTSRIGTNIFNTTSSNSSNYFESIWDNLTNGIESDINNEINSLAHDLGVHDFYSVHLLDYCEGFYTPTSVPNTTFPTSNIRQNVTGCSNRTAGYHFDPSKALQNELNKSHTGLTLNDLHWPKQVNEGLHTLRLAQKAAFVLYCISAALILFASLMSLFSFFVHERVSAVVDVLVWILAVVASVLASAVITAVAVKAGDVIDRYGRGVGVEANKGGKYMALTWVASGLCFLNVWVWVFEGLRGRRRERAGYRGGVVGK